jgi:hypothetical protein
MTVSLVNDFIRKTDLLGRVSLENNVQWFNGIGMSDVILTIILPIILIVIAGFMLKRRYDARQARLRSNNYLWSQTDDFDDHYVDF